MKLDPGYLRDQARRALREDLGSGDVTTRRVVPARAAARALLRSKEPMVLAGLPIAREVFRAASPDIRFHPSVREGARIGKGRLVATAEGPAASLLAAERTALNFLQRLSGIATYTASCVARARGRCAIRDTRKTSPGLRRLEKYAVRVGGGRNHRLGLHDGILIKHNHWRMAGGVEEAVLRARRGDRRMRIQVEVSTIRDLREAIAAKAEGVLLDNLPLATLRRAMKIARGRLFIEFSGGITRENLAGFAALRPDAISLGALTHSARWVDLSLFLEPWR